MDLPFSNKSWNKGVSYHSKTYQYFNFWRKEKTYQASSDFISTNDLIEKNDVLFLTNARSFHDRNVINCLLNIKVGKTYKILSFSTFSCFVNNQFSTPSLEKLKEIEMGFCKSSRFTVPEPFKFLHPSAFPKLKNFYKTQTFPKLKS